VERIEVPPSWESLPLSGMEGVVMVVGATDAGKTTLARYLFRRLGAHHDRLAFIDGDVGQATLGPPTTMTAALGGPADPGFPPSGRRYRVFVGDVSPMGHMLPLVVGAHRLVRKARASGATAIVYDTTGLVAASQGGGALKRALIDLLRPTVVVALQRGSELEHLLVPLRCSGRTRVVDREVARAVKRRGMEARHEHRAEQYRRTFQAAHRLQVTWMGKAIIPRPSFSKHRLVALEDDEGFVLALGIVTDWERESHVVELLSPLTSLVDVDTIHVGDVAVDPETFRDRRIRANR
jgi:polynucleotide 5'-hydroxyl-kinase GRC3/NOL9